METILNIQLLIEAGILPEPHAYKDEVDGSITVEWVFSGVRFGLNIEENKEQSGWHIISKQVTASGPLYS